MAKKPLIFMLVAGFLSWLIVAALLIFLGGCQKESKSESGPARGGSSSSVDASIDSLSNPSVREDVARSVDVARINLDSSLRPVDSPLLDSSKENVVDSQKTIVDTGVPLLKNGDSCNTGSVCNSGFCTNGVCCNVQKCEDTCIPSSTSNCPVYAGWTCAPYGTCRAF